MKGSGTAGGSGWQREHLRCAGGERERRVRGARQAEREHERGDEKDADAEQAGGAAMHAVMM